jgi:hypothetical protein
MDSVKPVVLVGVRNSAASGVALRWAVGEARRRHGQLLVIRSWDPEFDAPYATGSSHLTADQQRIAAGHGLSDLLAAAFGPQPGLTCSFSGRRRPLPRSRGPSGRLSEAASAAPSAR